MPKRKLEQDDDYVPSSSEDDEDNVSSSSSEKEENKEEYFPEHLIDFFKEDDDDDDDEQLDIELVELLHIDVIGNTILEFYGISGIETWLKYIPIAKQIEILKYCPRFPNTLLRIFEKTKITYHLPIERLILINCIISPMYIAKEWKVEELVIVNCIIQDETNFIRVLRHSNMKKLTLLNIDSRMVLNFFKDVLDSLDNLRQLTISISGVREKHEIIDIIRTIQARQGNPIEVYLLDDDSWVLTKKEKFTLLRSKIYYISEASKDYSFIKLSNLTNYLERSDEEIQDFLNFKDISILEEVFGILKVLEGLEDKLTQSGERFKGTLIDKVYKQLMSYEGPPFDELGKFCYEFAIDFLNHDTKGYRALLKKSTNNFCEPSLNLDVFFSTIMRRKRLYKFGKR